MPQRGAAKLLLIRAARRILLHNAKPISRQYGSTRCFIVAERDRVSQSIQPIFILLKLISVLMKQTTFPEREYHHGFSIRRRGSETLSILLPPFQICKVW